MNNLIELAKNMIKMGKIIPVTKGYYDVDGIIVGIIKKRGRTIISCSCTSCTRFCNQNNICSRQIAVILFESQDFKLKQIIREGLEYFENHKKLKVTPDPAYTVCLLNDLKKFTL